MPEFTVNPTRFDPYPNFKFKIKDASTNKYLAGVSKISALKRTTEVIKHRTGGDHSSSRKSPGRTEYAPVTVEKGMSHDNALQIMTKKVWNYSGGLGAESSLKDFRRDLYIEVYNEAGQLVIAWMLYRAWASVYEVSDLDANANAVYIEKATFEIEGFDADAEVVEPSQPSL